MIKTIMAFFGYIKVPQEAVTLSLELEYFIEKVCKYYKLSSSQKGEFDLFIKMSKTLTEFLRSGKLLNP